MSCLIYHTQVSEGIRNLVLILLDINFESPYNFNQPNEYWSTKLETVEKTAVGEIRVKWNGIKVAAALKYKDEAIAISYDTAFSLILQTFMIFCKARPRKKLLLPGKKAASL